MKKQTVQMILVVLIVSLSLTAFIEWDVVSNLNLNMLTEGTGSLGIFGHTPLMKVLCTQMVTSALVYNAYDYSVNYQSKGKLDRVTGLLPIGFLAFLAFNWLTIISYTTIA